MDWESHIDTGFYLFDCPHCGADISARWDGDDGRVILGPDPKPLPPTGAELHRNKSN